MTLTKTLAVLSLLGFAAMSSAFAADTTTPHQGGPVVEACSQDLKTLCPDVKPGDGQLKACLKKNRSKLSDGCKAAIKAQRSEHKAAAK